MILAADGGGCTRLGTILLAEGFGGGLAGIVGSFFAEGIEGGGEVGEAAEGVFEFDTGVPGIGFGAAVDDLTEEDGVVEGDAECGAGGEGLGDDEAEAAAGGVADDGAEVDVGGSEEGDIDRPVDW